MRRKTFDVMRITGTAENTAKGKSKSVEGRQALSRVNQALQSKNPAGVKKRGK